MESTGADIAEGSMSLDGSGASRAAGDRFHNEDKYLVNDGLGLYVVCDGMSDSPAGEVAARIAARALEGFIADTRAELDQSSGWMAQEIVEQGMAVALTAVTDAEQQDSDLRGLATTVTSLLAHHNFGIIGHRGDSRAYLIRRERAQQLTVDHELTEGAQAASDGPDAFDVFSIRFFPGDTIVLCTDGAEMVMDDDAFVGGLAGLSPRAVARRIVSAAHRRAPEVDATAVVVRFRGDREMGWLELSRPLREMTFGHMLEVA